MRASSHTLNNSKPMCTGVNYTAIFFSLRQLLLYPHTGTNWVSPATLLFIFRVMLQQEEKRGNAHKNRKREEIFVHSPLYRFCVFVCSFIAIATSSNSRAATTATVAAVAAFFFCSYARLFSLYLFMTMISWIFFHWIGLSISPHLDMLPSHRRQLPTLTPLLCLWNFTWMLASLSFSPLLFCCCC